VSIEHALENSAGHGENKFMALKNLKKTFRSREISYIKCWKKMQYLGSGVFGTHFKGAVVHFASQVEMQQLTIFVATPQQLH